MQCTCSAVTCRRCSAVASATLARCRLSCAPSSAAKACSGGAVELAPRAARASAALVRHSAEPCLAATMARSCLAASTCVRRSVVLHFTSSWPPQHTSLQMTPRLFAVAPFPRSKTAAGVRSTCGMASRATSSSSSSSPSASSAAVNSGGICGSGGGASSQASTGAGGGEGGGLPNGVGHCASSSRIRAVAAAHRRRSSSCSWWRASASACTASFSFSAFTTRASSSAWTDSSTRRKASCSPSSEASTMATQWRSGSKPYISRTVMPQRETDSDIIGSTWSEPTVARATTSKLTRILALRTDNAAIIAGSVIHAVFQRSTNSE